MVEVKPVTADRLGDVSASARACGPGEGPVRARVAVGVAAAPPAGGNPHLLLAAADAGLRRAVAQQAAAGLPGASTRAA